MKKIFFEILAHVPLAHAVFAFMYLLFVPTIRIVYFGTPYYWSDWDATRTTALALYLVVTGFVGFIATMARHMP